MYVIPETLKELAVPMGSVKRLPDDENPRIGDVPSMKESPEENTQYRPAVVNIREGTRYGDRTILAGNHTHQELEELGATEIAVTYVDVDDEAARKIVLADNRQGDLGTYDPEALAAAFQRMGDVEGTGYTPEFVERLLIGLGGPEPEGKADPDGLVEPPTTAVTKPGTCGSWVRTGRSAASRRTRSNSRACWRGRRPRWFSRTRPTAWTTSPASTRGDASRGAPSPTTTSGARRCATCCD